MPFADTRVDGAEATATAKAEAGDEAEREARPHEKRESPEARAQGGEVSAAEAEGRADRAPRP